MLPYANDLPSQFLQLLIGSLVARNILFDFGEPILSVGFRFNKAHWALVPKASINKNGNLLGSEHNIRLSWEILDIYAVSSPAPSP